MKNKDFKYNKEDLCFNKIDDNLVCKNCIYRKKDYIVNGKIVLYGYSNRYCEKYEQGKPIEVLSGEKCKLHS